MRVVNINEFSQDELFFCYSPNLYKFLRYKKDIEPIDIKVNRRTHKKYSVFIKSPELQNCLDEWKANKTNGIFAIRRIIKWTND